MLDFTPEHLDQLEMAVLTTPIKERAAIPDFQDVSEQYEPDFPRLEGDEDMILAAPSDLFSESEFQAQWGMVHDMAGGMIQMRTGAPCDLGTAARNEGGMIASQAAYALIKSSPALSKMLLSKQSTFVGQVIAIGMHGFACIQIVKASRATHIPDREDVQDEH